MTGAAAPASPPATPAPTPPKRPTPPRRPAARKFDGLLPVLEDAMAWLIDDQPDGAIVSHHGIYYAERVFDGVKVELAVAGVNGLPVLVFSLAGREWERPGVGGAGGSGRLLNAITKPDTIKLRKLVEQAGGKIEQTWNGAGTETFSVALAQPPLSDSLAVALANYRAYCPEHQTVFCTSDGCRWYPDGRAKLVRPDGWR